MSDYEILRYVSVDKVKKVQRKSRYDGLIRAIAKMSYDQAMELKISDKSKSTLYKLLKQAFPSVSYTISKQGDKWYIYRRES